MSKELNGCLYRPASAEPSASSDHLRRALRDLLRTAEELHFYAPRGLSRLLLQNRIAEARRVLRSYCE